MPDDHPVSWFAREGAPVPLGATWLPAEQAYNFALFSKHATAVTLLLYRPDELTAPAAEVRLHPLRNKSGRVWHCRVRKAEMHGARYYAYAIDGPKPRPPLELHAFDPQKILLDPYATAVYFPPTFHRPASMRPGSNAGQAPLGVLYEDEPAFDWDDDRVRFHEHDLVIYEMHVRGFTRSATSGVRADRRGTFLGVIEKIPYLKELGVTAVELMPVHQFDPQEGNYWGYMTLNFFAPHDGYATDRREAHNEFRTMVRALHEAGIEVLLDVVFNHTAEKDHRGPCYSYKGIDNQSYYMTTGNPNAPYQNFSGTGNTLNCASHCVIRMVLDSLRHWVTKCHVDGFRFDLASVFTRRADGSVAWEEAPLLNAIRYDPVLQSKRLIAEPWDFGGLYQLGRGFPGRRWFQWNGRFRDEVRRFVRGDGGLVSSLMCRLYGSDDLFPDDTANAYHPYQSVNYVTAHDGFTLYDLVSYNERHNWANGEQNRDGTADNYSWNCGWEGDSAVPAAVKALRARQARNFFALLMIANGTPMFCMGDEFLNTQYGNTNPYNQDNETTWLDWDQWETNRDFFRFVRLLIAFRKAHPTIARSRYWREDVRWHGTKHDIDWTHESRHFALRLHGASQNDADLYVMINAHERDLWFEIQDFSPGAWRLVCDTNRESPLDIYEAGTEPVVTSDAYLVAGRSVVILVRPR